MSNANEQIMTDTSIPEQEVQQRPKRRPKRRSRRSKKTGLCSSKRSPKQYAHRLAGALQMPKLKLSRPVEGVDKQSLRDLRNAQPQVNALIRCQGLTVPLPTRRKDLKAILLRGPSHNQQQPFTPVLKPMVLEDEEEIPEIRDLVDEGDTGIEFHRLTFEETDETMTENDQNAELSSMPEMMDIDRCEEDVDLNDEAMLA